MRGKYSEKLEEFIRANVPKPERVSGMEISEAAEKNGLEVIEHGEFLVIRSPKNKDAGLVIKKEVWDSPDGGIDIEYSEEDFWVISANQNIQYNPHLGNGAAIFREIHSVETNFWNFSQEILFGRIKEVVLPEPIVYLVVAGEEGIDVFLSEAEQYLKQLVERAGRKEEYEK